jgi:hypothetical protein
MKSAKHEDMVTNNNSQGTNPGTEVSPGWSAAAKTVGGMTVEPGIGGNADFSTAC